MMMRHSLRNLILHGKTDPCDVRFMNPAAHSYYLCLAQFKIVSEVLYYEWLDDLGIWSLQLFAPKSPK